MMEISQLTGRGWTVSEGQCYSGVADHLHGGMVSCRSEMRPLIVSLLCCNCAAPLLSECEHEHDCKIDYDLVKHASGSASHQVNGILQSDWSRSISCGVYNWLMLTAIPPRKWSAMPDSVSVVLL